MNNISKYTILLLSIILVIYSCSDKKVNSNADYSNNQDTLSEYLNIDSLQGLLEILHKESVSNSDPGEITNDTISSVIGVYNCMFNLKELYEHCNIDSLIINKEYIYLPGKLEIYVSDIAGDEFFKLNNNREGFDNKLFYPFNMSFNYLNKINKEKIQLINEFKPKLNISEKEIYVNESNNKILSGFINSAKWEKTIKLNDNQPHIDKFNETIHSRLMYYYNSLFADTVYSVKPCADIKLICFGKNLDEAIVSSSHFDGDTYFYLRKKDDKWTILDYQFNYYLGYLKRITVPDSTSTAGLAPACWLQTLACTTGISFLNINIHEAINSTFS